VSPLPWWQYAAMAFVLVACLVTVIIVLALVDRFFDDIHSSAKSLERIAKAIAPESLADETTKVKP
jgi:Tfp pilus assembly protein PilV